MWNNSKKCFLLFLDVSGKIRIWDTVNREHILKNEFQPLGGTIKDIGWSGDSQRIAVCGEGREKLESFVICLNHLSEKEKQKQKYC